MKFKTVIISMILFQLLIINMVLSSNTQNHNFSNLEKKLIIEDGNYIYSVTDYSTNNNSLQKLDSGTEPYWVNFLDARKSGYAVTDDHHELDAGCGDDKGLTLEAWVNFSDSTDTFGNAVIIKKVGAYRLYTLETYEYSRYYRGFGMKISCSGINLDINYKSNAGGFWNVGWRHVAGVVNKKTRVISLYLDGKLMTDWEITFTGLTVDNSDNEVKIVENYTGLMEELRISNIARYTDDYTIPTAPFEPDTNTCALWHFDEKPRSTIFHDSHGEDNVLIGHDSVHTVVEYKIEIAIEPKNFALYQNYPNPFNPSTTIKFSVPEAGVINLKVFNLIGQEIATLIDSYKPAGEYNVNWTAKDLPSGL